MPLALYSQLLRLKLFQTQTTCFLPTKFGISKYSAPGFSPVGRHLVRYCGRALYSGNLESNMVM